MLFRSEPELGRPFQDYVDAAKPGAGPIEVAANEVQFEPREKAGSEARGGGKKKVKKEMAQRKEVSFKARNARKRALDNR